MELENNDTPSATTQALTSPTVDAVDQAKEQSMDLVHKAQDKAGDMVDEVQSQLKAKLTEEKKAASNCLSHVAEVVQEAGKSLREKDQSSLGEYADSAARVVTNFSQYLEKTDIEHFKGDLESVARRRPALFVGSLFVVGLLAGRFLKSSSHHGTTTV